MIGTLFVVATPLGNLGDLTLRAAELFRKVPLVVAEDTRRTRQLLTHLAAHPKLLSFHAHSDAERLQAILDRLAAGEDVALVSDAGTPVISDPGVDLVARAREAGIPVVPIPGPSAVTTALSAAGIPGDRYLFLGFPPRKGKDRTRWLERALAEPFTVVCFEAPGRTGELLSDLAQQEPDRHAVVARELTKLHEEFVAGSLGELAAKYRDSAPRGEITIVVAGRGEREPVMDEVDIEARAALLLTQGQSPRTVITQLVGETGLPKNQVYRVVMKLAR
ncbi:MAG: 16S rRNA (cytidine(1402)-2'-O)-methyltransferase [Gemmatimonadota bacterium]